MIRYIISSSFEFRLSLKIKHSEHRLSNGSFQVPRAGFEPATTRSSASPSAAQGNWVERSPRLSYLGTCAGSDHIKNEMMRFKVFWTCFLYVDDSFFVIVRIDCPD